jgi:hypothetical protein
MADEKKFAEHVIHGTIPPEEWKKFFKQHFVPSPTGGGAGQSSEAAAKATGSCEDYGCPKTHPISGGALTGCRVEISGGRVTTVYCHYELQARG